jgi:MerR family transcriptional regulator/heat shock protein HspR
MNRQMQGFVDYVRTEMLTRMTPQQPSAGLVPLRRPIVIPDPAATVKPTKPRTRKK